MKKIYLILVILIYFSNTYAQSAIDLRSNPPKAQIFVDNQLKGKTPKIVELKPGTHTIKIVLNGYESQTFKTQAVKGRILKKSVELEAYGQLSVKTQPSGAVVFIDGNEIKQKSPVNNIRVTTGKHIIKIRSHDINGYEKEGLQIIKNVVINPARNNTLFVNFYKDLGSLILTSSPSAQIFIDNKAYGKTPQKIEYLTGGKHQITLKTYLAAPYDDDFTINTDVEIEPQKTFNQYTDFYTHFKLGRLKIVSNNEHSFTYKNIETNKSSIIRTYLSDNKYEWSNNVQLLTGNYALSWEDLNRNSLNFKIFNDKLTLISAPVKKKYLPEKKLTDVPNYMSRNRYISLYYNPLPESKVVHRTRYSFRYGTDSGFDKVIGTSFVLSTTVGMIAVLAGGGNNEAVVNTALIVEGSLFAAFLFTPFYSDSKVISLRSNIKKNVYQKEQINQQYNIISSSFERTLSDMNNEISGKNREIKKYNDALPRAKVTYQQEHKK